MQLHLEIISKDKYYLGENSSFVSDQKDLLIGRQQECDWVIDDVNKFLSGKHLQIQRKLNSYYVTDLSTNGTFLNSYRLERHQIHPEPLKEGDILIIGDIKVQVGLGETTTINIKNENQDMMHILNGYTPSHFHFDTEEEMHKEHERLADILSEEFPDVDHGDSSVAASQSNISQSNISEESNAEPETDSADYEYAFLPKNVSLELPHVSAASLATESLASPNQLSHNQSTQTLLPALVKTLLIHIQKQLVIDKIENPARFKLLSISNIWKTADSVEQVLSSSKSMQELQQDLQEVLHYLSSKEL